VRILATEILVPEIVVRVELDERNGPVFFGDSAKDGKADGVITPNANTTRSGFESRRDSLLDALKRVLDGKRIYREVAKVGDAIFREGIDAEHGIPGTDNRGLYADVAGAEARAGAVGCASIERDANQGDIQFFGLNDVREAHEGRDAGEAGEAKSVERLRMGQAKGATGFRHGEAY